MTIGIQPALKLRRTRSEEAVAVARWKLGCRPSVRRPQPFHPYDVASRLAGMNRSALRRWRDHSGYKQGQHAESAANLQLILQGRSTTLSEAMAPVKRPVAGRGHLGAPLKGREKPGRGATSPIHVRS